MLNSIIDVPSRAQSVFNSAFLLDKELITFNCEPRHEKNMGILYIDWILKQKLIDDHLNGLKFRSHDVYLNVLLTRGSLDFLDTNEQTHGFSKMMKKDSEQS